MIARTPIAPARAELNEPVKLPKLLQSPVNLPRRQFLAVAAAAPAVAVCALLSRPRDLPLAAPPTLPEDESGDDVGYHETEHVRRYYRSAGYF